MKMKDVFGEQGVKIGRDNTTIIDPVDLGEWGDFAAPETAMAAAHAINNHDSMLDGLKSARAWLGITDGFFDSPLEELINRIIDNADGK